MNDYSITNEYDYKEDFSYLDGVINRTLKHEKVKNATFSIVFVDNEKIQQLNKNYRNIDRENDVITFALDDDDTVINNSGVHILGDIYISIDRAHSQAEDYGHSFLREICFLAVHGFYHLLGYDHMTKEDEKVMFGKQEEVLLDNGITR